VALCKPVRGKTADRGACPHIDTAPVLGGGEPFVLEEPQGATDGHPGHTVVLHQPGLGRKLVAGVEPAPGHRFAKVISDLLVDRSVTSRVKLRGEHSVVSHAYASTHPYV